MRFVKRLLRLVAGTGLRWNDDQCYRLAAALAFYAVFAIFPLLLLFVTTVGFVLGGDPYVRQHLVASVASASSPEFRSLLDETLRNMQAHQTARGVGAAVGSVTLLFGASGVFSELESTLNLIWRVKVPASKGVWRAVLQVIKDKATSFAIVAGTAIALLASLAFSTVLSAVGAAVAQPLPWEGAECLLSVAFLTVLFAAMFRMLPRTAVTWHDVFGGAILTAVLFTILKRLLAWYLAHWSDYAAYGAAGAVLGVLTWIYVASMCLFFGAEFTRVYAERSGSLVGRAPTKAHVGQRTASTPA